MQTSTKLIMVGLAILAIITVFTGINAISTKPIPQTQSTPF